MVDILHRVGIGAPIARVYEALTTLDGTRGWWDPSATGDTKKGGVITVFKHVDMKVLETTQVEGPERGLQAIRAITEVDRLSGYPFCEAALGELELRCGRGGVAREHFEVALGLARNEGERRFLARRVVDCKR